MTRAFSKALRRQMAELVHCSSPSSACPLLPFRTLAPRVVPTVAATRALANENRLEKILPQSPIAISQIRGFSPSRDSSTHFDFAQGKIFARNDTTRAKRSAERDGL